MDSNKPLVSVLMNCYNGGKYLSQALDSIIAQTYKNWEIVFIDNCSNDNSKHIALSYDNVNYFKTEKNIPLGAARNFGLEKCTGQYVAFLDTDDIWMPNIIEKLLAAITSGDYALAYGGQIDIDSGGNKIKTSLPTAKRGYLFSEFIESI